MREAANRKDIIIFKDPHAYSLAPTIAVTDEGEWLVAFNQSLRRSPDRRHPPSDPQYFNHITRSSDQGDTWHYPRVLPGYDFHGVENPGLMRTSDGDILVGVYRRRFFPKETAEKLRDELPFVVFKDPYPWAVTHGGTYVHRSEDGGRTWAETSRVDTSPYVSGYTTKAGVELDDGTLLLPLAAAVYFTDTPWWGHPCPSIRLGNELGEHGRIKPGKSAVFAVQSRDGGRTWADSFEIARDPGLSLVEPAMVVLPGGKLLCMFRAGGASHQAQDGLVGEKESTGGEAGYLFQCRSLDNGRTWPAPEKTCIWGYPPHLLRLGDGRVLCAYGHRRAPFGIRACLSHDEGESWDIENEILIRTDFPDRDVGYPTSIQLDDGRIFTVYYGKDTDGVTCIQGSYYEV